MWVVMFECHKVQYQIISVACQGDNNRISIYSDLHRQVTLHLEMELSSLSSSFTKWIGAQKSYLKAIESWLFKCVTIPEKSSRRKRFNPTNSVRDNGPPIYVTCGTWWEMLDTLPSEQLTDSIKSLVAEISHCVPRPGKKADNGGDPALNMLRDEASEEWVLGFDRFRSSLVRFFGELSNFAECSVKMYAELGKIIQEKKSRYEENMKPQAKT